MPITIYKTAASPPARATLMVVEILGLKVRTKEVNLPTREHYSKEYLEKNPLHTVPLLEDGDLILSDSHAIITYLVSKYVSQAHEKLYPNDLKTRALIDQKLYFDATILFPRLKTVIYYVVGGNIGPTQEQISDITEAYDVLEKYLEKSTFLVGDDITLADVSCVSTVSSLDCILPVTKNYVKINDWWNRLKTEKWYHKENVPGLQLFSGFIRQFLR